MSWRRVPGALLILAAGALIHAGCSKQPPADSTSSPANPAAAPSPGGSPSPLLPSASPPASPPATPTEALARFLPMLQGPAAGSELRYRWKPGERYAYEFAVSVEAKEMRRSVEGTVVYSLLAGKDAESWGGKRSSEGGTGTAFVVTANGDLATCAHVVRDAARIEVTLGDKKYDAEVTGLDNANDLALLHIPAQGLAPLPLGDSGKVELAQGISVVGYPLASRLGSGVKMTQGSVAGVADGDGNRVFQIDASVNPGNSGGPAVNSRGEAIGVVNAKLVGEEVSNVGFAVPGEHLRRLMEGHGLRPTLAGADRDLAGPDLARRVTPSVALVTLAAGPAKTWGDNFAAFGAQGRLTTKVWRLPGPGLQPTSPPTVSSKDVSGKVRVDEFGNVADSTEEGDLPLFFGSLGQLIFEPLSPGGERTWQVVHPTGLVIPPPEPAASPMERFGGLSRPPGFHGFRPPGPPPMPGGFGPAYRGKGRGASPPASTPSPQAPSAPLVFRATERIVYEAGPPAGDTVPITRRYVFSTAEKSDVPLRLILSHDGQIAFNTKNGLPDRMECRGSLQVKFKSEELTIPITAQYRRVDPGAVGATVAAPTSPPASPSPPAASPQGPAVDLLSLVDPQRDRVQGQWTKEAGSLLAPADGLAALAVRATVPEEYTLTVVAERTSGKDSLNIGLLVGGRQTMLALEGWSVRASGLNTVGGRTADRNETTFTSPVFKPGGPSTIVCTVRRSGVRAAVDGREVMNWSGDPGKLSLDTRFWKGIPPDRLFLGTWQTAFRVSKWELVPLSTSTAAGPSAPAAPSVKPVSLDEVLTEVRGAAEGPARRAAIVKLCFIPLDASRHAEVAKLLNGFLTGPDTQARDAAVQALGVWGHRGNVPALVKLLDGAETALRANVVRALGMTKDAKAAEALAPLVENSRDRFSATSALRAIGPPAEDAVLPLLEHADPQVRREACRVLGHVGGDKSLAALKKRTDSEAGVKSAARLAISQIQRRIEHLGGTP